MTDLGFKDIVKDQIKETFKTVNFNKVRRELEESLPIDLPNKKTLVDDLICEYLRDTRYEDEEDDVAADVTRDELKKEINEILKNANLSKTCTKDLRLHLQETLNVDLTNQGKLIDDLVMEYLRASEDKAMKTIISSATARAEPSRGRGRGRRAPKVPVQKTRRPRGIWLPEGCPIPEWAKKIMAAPARARRGRGCGSLANFPNA